MTLNEWIEERRAIQRDGRGCTCQIDWRYPCPEHSPGNPVSQMVLADSVREFPRALDAIERVMRVHWPDEFADAPGEYFCNECQRAQLNGEWPCMTVQAIEGAINE